MPIPPWWFALLRILSLMIVLGACTRHAEWPLPPAREVPEPVRLFETLKAQLAFRLAFPRGQVIVSQRGVALGGLDVCALLDLPTPAYALPKHRGRAKVAWVDPSTGALWWFQSITHRDTCVPRLRDGTLIIAYGGWCTAGVEDVEGPHFSPSVLPLVTRQHYGETTVLYFNHYLKSFVVRSAAGEHAALWYLSQASFAQGLDVRAPNSDILPQSLSPVLPPQRQRR